jgi:hypothetical protein
VQFFLLRDFTAKLHNNEDLPDVGVTYVAGPSNEHARAIGPEIPTKMMRLRVDPMIESIGSAPDKWEKVGVSC